MSGDEYCLLLHRNFIVDVCPMDLFIKILYALPVYQSSALALLLFFNGRQVRSRSRIIMAFFELICALYFVFNFQYALRSFEILVRLYFLILPIILLFLPMFYIYLLSVTTVSFRFKQKYLWHFLPAFVILLANLPFLFASYQERLAYISHSFDSANYNSVILYLTVVYVVGIFGVLSAQLVYYFYMAVKLYKSHRKYIENHYSFTENISLNWIVALMASLVLFFISNQMLYMFGIDHSFFSPLYYNIVMLGITLFMGYYALYQRDLKPSELSLSFVASESVEIPDVLPVNANVGNVLSTEEQVVAAEENVTVKDENEDDEKVEETKSQGKYVGSALSTEHKMLLVKRLEALMFEEKIFVNDSLSVEDVANRLGTNSKYVSQVINEQYGKNFYNYINSYRVEEAQKLLLSGGMEKYTILGIAQMVGFGSKSSFNSSFKRITGLTPSEFMKANGS
ncbi:MAG TPA: AraC family transcriptional regulator [Lentimicrobium sp.]|nr:AraC family transcriptional regulator [Lentimicrobium sp.]